MKKPCAAPSGIARWRLPHSAVEWSRHQIMCRTGMRGPGQSHAVPWGSDHKHKTFREAKLAADEWVDEQLAGLGI